MDCQTDDVVIRTQYESGQHLLKCSCKLELLLSASDEVIIVKTSIDGAFQPTRRHSAVSRYHWLSGRMSAEFNVSPQESFMPTMFFAKDGRRPDTQEGLGKRLSFDEAQAIFGSETIQYVGTEAPNINPDNPSHSLKNVVLEVEADEGFSSLLPKTGFYLVPNVHSTAANELLSAHRSAV